MEKLTNKDLIGLLNGIQTMEQKAYAEIEEIKPTILHKLIRNRKRVVDKLNVFEDSRIAMVEELGKRNKSGELIVKDNVVQFNKKKQDEFSSRLQKLMFEEVEVDFDQFGAEELEDSKLACCPKENQFLPIVMEFLVKE